MKRKMSIILSAILLTSIATACGNNKDTSTSDSIQTVTEAASNTTTAIPDGTAVPATAASTEETTQPVTEQNTEKPAIADDALSETNIEQYITMADKSSLVMTEIGNWQSYVENFKMPENTYILVDTGHGNELSAASAGDKQILQIKAMPPADEADAGPTGYILFTTSTDVYAIIADKEGSETQHRKAENDDTRDDNSIVNSFSNELSGKLAFKEYIGEKTIDGETYDVIACTSAGDTDNNDQNETIDLYFTKDGAFYKIEAQSNSLTVTVREISGITIPDKEWTESDEETMAEAYIGMTYALVLSMTENASN